MSSSNKNDFSNFLFQPIEEIRLVHTVKSSAERIRFTSYLRKINSSTTSRRNFNNISDIDKSRRLTQTFKEESVILA